MSWDKLTINRSEIDKTIELLKEFNIKYKLKILGEVDGYGCNDDNKKYKIRLLNYKDKVIIEQMLRTKDCDNNDIIISKKFSKNTSPKTWKIWRWVK